MLDSSSLILIIAYVGYVSTEYKIYSDGWVPVSREQIYNQIHRGAESNYIYPTFESVDQINEELKSIEPFDSEYYNKENVDHSIINDNINRNISTPINLEDDSYTEINVLATESPRKAKNINYPKIQSSSETFIVGDNIKEKDGFKNIIADLATTINDKTVSYAVTEDIDDIDVSEKPNFNKNPTTVTENEDFNSKLINILLKYNIRTDDNLKNYDLSRQAKIQKPITIMRNWIPYRYNNLNHLPVDPLLAVFLSNYGFYIRNLYGMKSNYNNLYGYLASNNIHNNKPFGLYKVFSDTDSWN